MQETLTKEKTMFQKIKKTATVFTLTAVFTSQAFAFGNINQPSNGLTIEIQNLTANQPMTPPVISTGITKLFQVGTQSSEALRLLAEDGDASGFENMRPSVKVTKNLIMPGEKAVFTLNKGSNYTENFISIVSMLARTNDAFVGVSGERIYSPLNNKPVFIQAGQTKTLFARVYDAGTEANTESCDHIPAPPCNSPKVRVVEGAEGLVLPHTGLNLTGDLSVKDKFAPIAAKITITRNF